MSPIRIGIAIFLVLLFAVTFYLLNYVMPALEWEWRETDKQLAMWQKLLVLSSWHFGAFWYLYAFATLIVTLGILFIPLPGQSAEPPEARRAQE